MTDKIQIIADSLDKVHKALRLIVNFDSQMVGMSFRFGNKPGYRLSNNNLDYVFDTAVQNNQTGRFEIYVGGLHNPDIIGSRRNFNLRHGENYLAAITFAPTLVPHDTSVGVGDIIENPIFEESQIGSAQYYFWNVQTGEISQLTHGVSRIVVISETVPADCALYGLWDASQKLFGSNVLGRAANTVFERGPFPLEQTLARYLKRSL